MEKLKFNYSLSSEQFKKGMLAAGAFKPQRGKQVLVTVLCLFIVFNSASALVAGALQGKAFDLIQLVFILIGIGAAVYIWVSPVLMMKSAMKNHLETEEIEIEETEDGIEIRGNETVNITNKNYIGVQNNKGFLVIYYDRTYIAIPESEITDEISEALEKKFDQLMEMPQKPRDDYDNPEFGIWSPENAKSALEDENEAVSQENEEASQENEENNQEEIKEEGENLSDE